MAAMAGKRPAIMQSPNDPRVFLGEIVEKKGIVKVIAVNIVEVNEIWRNVFKGSQKPFGCEIRVEPM
jgi:hypothetical protein